jgi:hypothetical protein
MTTYTFTVVVEPDDDWWMRIARLSSRAAGLLGVACGRKRSPIRQRCAINC